MKKFEHLGRMLSKNEQKKIKGGNPPADGPSSPSGGYGPTQYKCCWNDYPDNCSICVNCTAECTCVSGASLKVC